MGIFISLVIFAIFVYQMILFCRIVFTVILSLSPAWKPRGVALVVAEFTYTVTDPPIKALRKVIPALKLGPVRLDLAFLVLFFSLSIVAGILAPYAAR